MRWRIALLTWLLGASSTSATLAATMTLLPDLNNDKPLHVVQFLPDGRTLAGIAGDEFFHRAPDTGRVVAALLPTSIAGKPVTPVALSPDGNAAILGADLQTYRWASTGEPTAISPPVGYENYHAGKVLSFDGSVIYGDASNGESKFFYGGDGLPYEVFIEKPFRWTANEGGVSLGFSGNVRFVSADGRVIAGQDPFSEQSKSQSFVWSEELGRRSLGDLPAGLSNNYVVDGSADGRTIVGDAMVHDAIWNWRAYKWTEADGMTSLGAVGDGSLVTDLSANGQVAIGDVIDWTPVDYGGFDVFYAFREPFVWDENHGMRRLRDILAASGISLDTREQGATHEVLQVSPDGQLILGLTNKEGPDRLSETTYWIVNLTVPEPPAFASLLISTPLVLLYRRRSMRQS